MPVGSLCLIWTMMMVSFLALDGRKLTVDDEENLRRHAARGAQAAIRAAKDKAQAFDRRGQEEDLDSELHDCMQSEMLTIQWTAMSSTSRTLHSPPIPSRSNNPRCSWLSLRSTS